jgi:ketosteroid isomerase-like protein
VSTADLRAVEAANAAFYGAIERGDIDLMEALWLDEATGEDVVSVHPGWPLLRGRGEVLRSWTAVMAGTAYIQFFLTDVHTRVHGDVAVVTCAENILTGAERVEFGFAGGQVVATNVFRRTPTGWRLWVHHASPVVSVSDDAGNGTDGREDSP